MSYNIEQNQREMFSPPTPVPEAKLLKRQKNKEAAKTSRGNKKQSTSAYVQYHEEMELWIPQFQARYDHLLALLTKARPYFDANSLGIEIDDARAILIPQIPNAVAIEKSEKSGPGRPAEKAIRRSRGFAANIPVQSVPNFNAPPPIAQPSPQLRQLANPPPAANQQAQFPDSATQFPPTLNDNILNPFNNATAQRSVPNMEFGGLVSGYSSPRLSSQLNQDDSFLRGNVSYAAGITMDDISPPKPTANMEYLSNPGHNNVNNIPDLDLNQVNWFRNNIPPEFFQTQQQPEYTAPAHVYNNIVNNNYSYPLQPQQPQQLIAPASFYNHIGDINNTYPLQSQQPQQPQQQQTMNTPAAHHQNASSSFPQQQQPTHIDPSLQKIIEEAEWEAKLADDLKAFNNKAN